ncbi:PBP1A family penicillin-binding protein [Lachnospiraceae bacterium NSJ-143]|nr:PBP1A family penicillin-binding protein [Lachnospiraceae bacterium NSJ-143]
MNYSQDASHRTRNSKKRKRRKRKATIGVIILRIFIVLAVVGCFAVGGAFIGAYTGIIESAPALSSIDVTPESYTSIIYDENGNEIDSLHGEENREYVKLSQIPLNLQNAVVAIEDERFYEHNGIDIKGMFRALFVNIKNRDMTQGASTITQQLMKNEVLTAEKKLSRKLQEQYLAVSYEKQLAKKLGSKEKAKDYILELYLNTISLNHGLNGVEAASKFYFGKDVSELTLAQCASIAGITKNPSAYSPLSHPDNNRDRMLTVLKKMLDLGYITESEYKEACAEDVAGSVIGTNDTNDGTESYHSYFVDTVITELAKQLQSENKLSKQQAYNMIYSGGLKIYTTVNTSMQDTMENSFADDSLFPPKASSLTASYTISIMDNETEEQQNIFREKVVSSREEAEAFAKSVRDEVLNDSKTMILDRLTMAKSLQAAMVIMDYHNGQVKAIVGGREKSGDLVFNRATQALRQPGSCFKVLAAYAPAIDQGLVMPGTGIRDEYFEYNGWVPKNWYSSGYRGMCTVREGIQDSLNILAAKVIVMVGVDTALDYLENFGFTTLVTETNENGLSDRGPAISLGGVTNGVSVLELTAAYSTIANNGEYIKPVFYTKVLDHDGNVIIDNSSPETHRVIKETTAYLLTDMMKDVITKGTGRLAKFSNISMSEAGKTGTTSDDKDLVFVGYTPYYCAGIWMGYDNPKKIEYDKSYHLLLWKDIMEKIHNGLSDPGFSKPSGITTKSICSASGKSPNKYCSEDYYGNTIASDLCASEYVDNNGACELHKQFTVCSETGKLPGPNCKTMSVVLAVEEKDGKYTVVNAPSEAPEGKVLINLNETCTEEHAPDINDIMNEGGGIISGGEGNNSGSSQQTPNGTAPKPPVTEPVVPPTDEPQFPDNNAGNEIPQENHDNVQSPPDNNGMSILPGIDDE